MSITTGLRSIRESQIPRHGRAEDFRSLPKRTTYAVIGALIFAAFGAGNWLGSSTAVDAFVRDNNSPATAPAGYRCWNEIHVGSPKGYQQMCGVVQEVDSPR